MVIFDCGFERVLRINTIFVGDDGIILDPDAGRVGGVDRISRTGSIIAGSYGIVSNDTVVTAIGAQTIGRSYDRIPRKSRIIGIIGIDAIFIGDDGIVLDPDAGRVGSIDGILGPVVLSPVVMVLLVMILLSLPSARRP